jgi:hypothetical protein
MGRFLMTVPAAAMPRARRRGCTGGSSDVLQPRRQLEAQLLGEGELASIFHKLPAPDGDWAVGSQP